MFIGYVFVGGIWKLAIIGGVMSKLLRFKVIISSLHLFSGNRYFGLNIHSMRETGMRSQVTIPSGLPRHFVARNNRRVL